MNRRELLKGAAGLLGSAFLPPFLRPAGAADWGAISGVLPTHQFIVEQALAMLAEDPLSTFFDIPDAPAITANDYVLFDPVTRTLEGPGPDVPGNSPYSWHYFNPVTRKGAAPQQVGDFWEEMMCQRIRGGDQSGGAAWSAHFLADMFVPYHTLGLPTSELMSWYRGGRCIFDDRICGDWRIMYSPSEPAPPGWGLNNDHTDTVARFDAVNPGAVAQGVDWFDPWYWNGYTQSFLGDMTGSHQTWELRAEQHLRMREMLMPQFIQNRDNLRAESFYDPLWVNMKAAFQDEFWRDQVSMTRAFTEACADRTRRNTARIMSDPTLGIAMAIRGVATLYRASMTSLGLAVHREPLPEGGHVIVATVQNRHPWSHVRDLDLRLSLESRTGAQSDISRIQGNLAPGQIATVTWNAANDSAATGTIEASGEFISAPDLGYSRIPLQLAPSVPREIESDQPQPEPETPPEEGVDRNVLTAWAGVWDTELLWGQDWGWRPADEPLHIRVVGSTVTLTRGSGEPGEARLSDGGRCLIFFYSEGGGTVSMNICLDPGGNTFQGYASMRTTEEVLQPRIRGRRRSP